MRYALLATLATSLVLCPIAHAQTPEAKTATAQTYDPTKPYPPYTAPRLKIGQPDLQGFWHNTTLTKMTRPAGVSSLVYSEAEVAKLEQEMADEIEEASAPTAADAPAEYVIPKDIKPEYLAGGGATGGYNRFWIDPGNHVMRVNGEPRSSIITTPTGTAPARKAGASPAPAPEPPAFVKLLGPDSGARTVVRQSGIARDGALHRLLRTQRRTADVRQRLLQQQLPDRAIARARRDRDGDGARRAHRAA